MSEPRTAPPPTPRAALAALVADREAVQRAAQAAPLLFPEADPSVAFARCLFALPGWGGPAVPTVLEFVRRLRASGWQVLLPGLETPKAGDLYVLTNAERIPESLGFVGARSQDGAFFSGVRAGEARERVSPQEVGFFLRMPCPTCDQAQAAGPPVKRP